MIYNNFKELIGGVLHQNIYILHYFDVKNISNILENNYFLDTYLTLYNFKQTDKKFYISKPSNFQEGFDILNNYFYEIGLNVEWVELEYEDNFYSDKLSELFLNTIKENLDDNSLVISQYLSENLLDVKNLYFDIRHMTNFNIENCSYLNSSNGIIYNNNFDISLLDIDKDKCIENFVYSLSNNEAIYNLYSLYNYKITDSLIKFLNKNSIKLVYINNNENDLEIVYRIFNLLKLKNKNLDLIITNMDSLKILSDDILCYKMNKYEEMVLFLNSQTIILNLNNQIRHDLIAFNTKQIITQNLDGILNYLLYTPKNENMQILFKSESFYGNDIINDLILSFSYKLFSYI